MISHVNERTLHLIPHGRIAPQGVFGLDLVRVQDVMGALLIHKINTLITIVKGGHLPQIELIHCRNKADKSYRNRFSKLIRRTLWMNDSATKGVVAYKNTFIDTILADCAMVLCIEKIEFIDLVEQRFTNCIPDLSLRFHLYTERCAIIQIQTRAFFAEHLKREGGIVVVLQQFAH